jgi:microcystin-dependent protein
MAYQVRFTDNINKEPITVEDNTVDQSTSVTFPGRNTTGYGQIVAENFLHLLENFSSTSEPTNPVEGQLWYDKTDGVTQLKIYDGTSWTAAGGLKKGTAEPAVSSSVVGDLWVNTDTQQLYLFSGSGWILVGPRFSSGAKTGAEPETIVDTLNNNQSVVSNYINGERVAIISATAFTPKATINGFIEIKAGVNLNSNYRTYWGVAETANSLLIGTTAVASSNFLRSDVTSTTNFPINVRNALGLNVGEDGQLSLTTDGTSGVITHRTSGSNLDIRVNNNGSIKTVIRVDSQERVGINKINPQEAMDVEGNILASGTITSTSIVDSTSTTTGSLILAGGAAVGKSLYIGENVTVDGNFNIANELLPNINQGANIGSIEKQFNRVFASRFDGSFYGGLTGNVIGSVTGSSSKLASSTIFDLTGDITSNEVEFDGQVGTPQLTTATATGNGTSVTLTFAAQNVAPYPVGSTITVAGIVPIGYRGTYTVTGATVNSVTYNNTTTGSQTTAGTITAPGAVGNRKRFISKLSETFIGDKTPITDPLLLGENDEFIVQTESEGLKKIKKRVLWERVPRTPIGSVIFFAGPEAPTGWLLCDGSEVEISQYDALFDVIKYTYGDPLTLLGIGTFKLPDLRGRMGLGIDNMNNGITVPAAADITQQIQPGGGSANRVTSTNADIDSEDLYAARNGSGSENVTIDKYNLPEHEHDMQGDKSQYYAFRNFSGAPEDTTGAISGQGSTTFGLGQYLDNSGGIKVPVGTTFEQTPMNVMNPYLAMNFIIYTGQDV